MKLKIAFVFCMLAFCATAQTLVLEKPEIPSPEKEVLFFLQDNYFNNLNNYKGNVTSVVKTNTTYNNDKSIRTFNTLTIASVKQNKTLKQQLRVKKVIDKIGIDSIAKKENNIFELYKFNDESDYTWQKFILKNNLITEYLDNGAVEYVHTTYSYNKLNHLTKIVTKNDYGVKEIIIGLTMSNGKVTGKTIFKKHDNYTLVTEISYQYKNNLLVAISSKEVQYKFQLTEDVLDLLHTLLTSNYYNKETIIKENNVLFKYNDNQQLIEVKKKINNWFWNSNKTAEEVRVYTITHQPNKLIVNSISPEKKEYIYVLDAQQNPTEINSFSFKGDKKIFEEKTTFKINYK